MILLFYTSLTYIIFNTKFFLRISKIIFLLLNKTSYQIIRSYDADLSYLSLQ